jgi:hypothetical protein
MKSKHKTAARFATSRVPVRICFSGMIADEPGAPAEWVVDAGWIGKNGLPVAARETFPASVAHKLLRGMELENDADNGKFGCICCARKTGPGFQVSPASSLYGEELRKFVQFFGVGLRKTV